MLKAKSIYIYLYRNQCIYRAILHMYLCIHKYVHMCMRTCTYVCIYDMLSVLTSAWCGGVALLAVIFISFVQYVR